MRTTDAVAAGAIAGALFVWLDAIETVADTVRA